MENHRDILFVLICIANQTGVNLTAALERNLQKKTARDAQRHQANEKLQAPGVSRAIEGES